MMVRMYNPTKSPPALKSGSDEDQFPGGLSPPLLHPPIVMTMYYLQSNPVIAITVSMHEIATLIERTANEAGDTAAASGESAAAIDEITRMIQTVNKVAVQALEANKRFRVD